MTRKDAIARVLQVASGEVGVKEQPLGSNFGPRVGQYLAVTGIRRPAFWCAAWVAWVGQSALGDAWPLPLSASCDVLLDYARRHRCLSSSPSAGDVFLVLASDNDATHTGLVTGINAGGVTFGTIEGNSNDGGSRNGIEVARRPHRSVDPPGAYRCVFIRWADLIDEDAGEGQGAESWAVRIGEARLPAIYESGTTIAPLRQLLAAIFGSDVETSLGWEDGPTWEGRAMPLTVTIRAGVGYVKVRAFADWSGLQVVPDPAKREIRLKRPG